jgi:hypothetical protein
MNMTKSGSSPPAWHSALELAVLVVVLALGAAGCLVARQRAPGYDVDLTREGVLSPLNMVGLHAVERNQEFAYRWSSGYTFAQLPHAYYTARSYIAGARLQAANPQGPQPLTFLANERPLITITPTTSFRIYRLVLPPGAGDEVTLRFAFQTPAFSPPGDTRKLGVIVTSVGLRPAPAVDWAAVAAVPIVLTGLWAWLRWRGGAAGASLLICAVQGAALLALYAVYRPAPLSYPLLALLATLGGAAGAWIAREAASRLSLAMLSTLVSFSGMLWPSWITDDAFISFRYAQNLVAGHGLVYNVGERVEGYTNFLWTMLAALALWLGGDLVFLSYLGGVILALSIVLLSYWLARRLLGPVWALVAALIVATSQSLLVYTARGAGLETGLFALLVLAGGAFYLQSRFGWCGLLYALATLTRPEGALVMGLTLAHGWFVLLADRRPTTDDRQGDEVTSDASRVTRHPAPDTRHSTPGTRLLGVYLLIVLPYFVWRLSYYGDPLPNTFYAKAGGGAQQILRGLEYAGGFALALGGPLLLVTIGPWVASWRSAVRDWRGYLALLLIVYTAYIIAVGGDHFPGERFFVSLVPWLALLIAGGLAWLYAWLRERPPLRRAAPALLAVLLVAYSAYALARSAAFDTVIGGDDESVWIWRELGWWFNDHAAADESIAALGAGAIAYYSDRPVIDLLGLTEKHIARVSVANPGVGVAGHEKRDPAYVLDVRRPTYIPQIWEEYFGGEQHLLDRYAPITIQTRYGREMKLWKRIR